MFNLLTRVGCWICSRLFCYIFVLLLIFLKNFIFLNWFIINFLIRPIQGFIGYELFKILLYLGSLSGLLDIYKYF